MDQLTQLQQENLVLRARVAALEEQVRFLGKHQTLARGMSGETLIAKLVNGSLTSHVAPTDIDLTSGHSIEVKTATLTTSRSSSYRRWQWEKILGGSNSKRYDFLVLAGEADPDHRSSYVEPEDPWVFFVVPFEEVPALTTNGVYGARKIQLCSNPLRASGRSKELFTKYQVPASDLNKMFDFDTAKDDDDLRRIVLQRSRENPVRVSLDQL